MNVLVTLLALLFTLQAGAANYYFSASGNDSTGNGSQGNPWRSIAKLNSIFSGLKAGDSVLLKRGDSFYGRIRVTSAAGTSGAPIIIGAYGKGARPIWHGWQTAAVWSNTGNVWHTRFSSLPAGYQLIGVSIGDQLTPFGRTPDKGWNTIDKGGSLTSFSDRALSGAPFWTGANLVIKKRAWIVDRNIVAKQEGSTITFNMDDPNGTSNPTQDGYGYFLANDTRCLNVQNEWAWNKSTKTFSVYSKAQPADIKVAAIDTLVYLTYQTNNITFSGIEFQGSNTFAIYGLGNKNLKIQNCTFRNHGRDAINLAGDTATVIEDCIIRDCWNNGIVFDYSNVGCIVRCNTLRNIGMRNGMGGSGDYTYLGIKMQGENGLVEYCDLDSIGYHGIAFTNNDSIIIRYNLVNHATALKGDGAGIYVYRGPYGTREASGRKVYNNVVLNSVGPLDGTVETGFQGYGIYSDGNAGAISFTNNTVAYCSGAGLHQNAGAGNIWRNNVLYGNAIGIYFQEDEALDGRIASMQFKRNLIYSTGTAQVSVGLRTGYDKAKINGFGVMDSNYILRPFANTDHFLKSENGFRTSAVQTLAQWRNSTGYETATIDAIAGTTTKQRELFLYNGTPISAVKPFPSPTATYINIMTGVRYTGSITLAAYSSVVLMKAEKDDVQPSSSRTTGKK